MQGAIRNIFEWCLALRWLEIKTAVELPLGGGSKTSPKVGLAPHRDECLTVSKIRRQNLLTSNFDIIKSTSVVEGLEMVEISPSVEPQSQRLSDGKRSSQTAHQNNSVGEIRREPDAVGSAFNKLRAA